jgi:hypothetical protein
MARKRVALGGLIPVEFEALDPSSAVGLNSTSRASGQVLHISVATQSVRYRADGADPTANTGVLLTAANSPYWFHGYNGTSIKFIEDTGGAELQVMVYKHD